MAAYKLPPKTVLPNVDFDAEFNEIPLDTTEKTTECEAIEKFVIDMIKEFKNMKKTPTISYISASKICELNGEKEVRIIRNKIEEFNKKKDDLTLTPYYFLLENEGIPLVNEIYGLIVKNWRGGKRTRRKKQKRRTKKLKRRS